jgi:hypothetical protein
MYCLFKSGHAELEITNIKSENLCMNLKPSEAPVRVQTPGQSNHAKSILIILRDRPKK